MIQARENALFFALVGLVALLLLALVGVEVHRLLSEVVRDMQLTQVGS